MPLFYIFHTHEDAHSYCTLIVCPRADPIYINQGRKDVIYQGRWYIKDGSIPPVLLAHAMSGALLTNATTRHHTYVLSQGTARVLPRDIQKPTHHHT